MTDYLFIHQIAKIADYYYPPGGVKYESQWSHLNRGFTDEVLPYMKENSIIFADTLWLDRFELFNKIPVTFILITAEADVTIPYNNYKKKIDCCYRVLENPLLKKWYSINVDYDHPKLVPIPLGLPKHIPFIVEEEEEAKKKTYMGWIVKFTIDKVSSVMKEREMKKESKKNLVYSRMTLENSDDSFHDREGVRRLAVEILRQKGIEIEVVLKPFQEYLDELVTHKYCLSLPGKGMDCYRTWEALTLGVIPIVLRTRHMDSIYEGLPVLIVDDIGEISKEFLEKEYERLVTCFESDECKKRLTSSYWIDKILENLS